MRKFLDMVEKMLKEDDLSMAIVETDPRFNALITCMIGLRGSDIEMITTDDKVESIRRLLSEFTSILADLEYDYDVPINDIRDRALAVIRSRDH